MLNKIMFIIPQKVQIISIENTNSNHIVIEAVSEKYEQFKTRLRTSYEDGNASFIEVLLDSHSIMDFLVRVERIGQMLE